MMEKAIWLASVFGPFLAIMGLWMLFCSSCFSKVMASIKSTPGLIYLEGVFNLFVGLVILRMFNMWQWNLTLLITLLGWFMVLKAICAFFMPKMYMKSATGKKHMHIWGLLPLIVGLALCWLGYYS